MRLCLMLVVACATAPLRPAVGLHEVESPPAGCRLVGRFEGVSAQPGEAGMAQAREQARAKAAGAGATHRVVGNEWQSPDATCAVGERCDCGPAQCSGATAC